MIRAPFHPWGSFEGEGDEGEEEAEEEEERRRASSTASLDLPTPVVPQMARSGRKGGISEFIGEILA